MTLTAEELIDLLRKRINALRNIQTLVTNRDFQRLFEATSDKEQVQTLINIFDHVSLRVWYKRQRLSELGILSIRELRIIAAKLKVPNYSTLPKALLLSEIVQRKDNEQTAHQVAS